MDPIGWEDNPKELMDPVGCEDDPKEFRDPVELGR